MSDDRGRARPLESEKSGRLELAMVALFEGDDLLGDELQLIRLYLRQWIGSPVWQGPKIDELKRRVDELN